MHTEIEVKARLRADQKNSLTGYFNNLYNAATSEYKCDAYFKEPSGELYRLRKQNNEYIYTKKNNSLSDGVEVNSEDERILSQSEYDALFKDELLFIKKTKEGYIWSTKDFYGYDMNIEIVNVKGHIRNKGIRDLGYFIETEIIAPKDASDHICNNIKAELLNYYKVLGVFENIENRKYMAMIEE